MRRWLAAGAALAVLVAGCGDDDELYERPVPVTQWRAETNPSTGQTYWCLHTGTAVWCDPQG